MKKRSMAGIGAAIAGALGLYYGMNKDKVDNALPTFKNAPDVIVDALPSCPEPQIVEKVVYRERVVPVTIYKDKPLQVGCHLDSKTGKVYGINQSGSQYVLFCYMSPDGKSVRAHWQDKRDYVHQRKDPNLHRP